MFEISLKSQMGRLGEQQTCWQSQAGGRRDRCRCLVHQSGKKHLLAKPGETKRARNPPRARTAVPRALRLPSGGEEDRVKT